MRSIILFNILFSMLFAHDAWITYEKNGSSFHYGHLNPKDTDAKNIHFVPSKVQKSCRRATGEIDGWNSDCDEFIAHYESGTWSKTLDGTKQGSKKENQDALFSWKSEEVVLFIRHQLSSAPNGFALRPTDKISNAEIGERFTFQAILDNKPLPNIPVAYFGSTRGVTDSNGCINIRLRTPGMQQITASYTSQSDVPYIDKKITSYTLNFEVLK